MPRRPPLGLALLLAAACSAGPVAKDPDAVDVPSVNGLPTSTLITCADIKSRLPDALPGGAERRRAVPESDTTSAYGDPVVTVRCGVGAGSERDEPYTFNDVRWAMHDTGASRTWTTLGRDVNVEVVVPDHWSSQAELVGAVALAVAKARS